MLFWLEAGALVDYLLHYGDYLIFIANFGIEYGMIELAAVTLGSIYLIVKNLVK